MTKKSSRIVAVIMLIIAIIFFVVALNNPQASFPWSNIITYILYGIYVIIMIILFIAPFKRKKIYGSILDYNLGISAIYSYDYTDFICSGSF